MFYTVIAKPTKACNADCEYCSSPPDDVNAWTNAQFQAAFQRLQPALSNRAFWIWHGGEPMLMPPSFYERAYAFTRNAGHRVRFSMQTNLLLYKSRRWRDVFIKLFDGGISTSFDPDERSRTIQGSAEKYTRVFFSKLDEVMDDGIRPLVIGTYSEETAHLAHSMYERSRQRGDRAFHIRANYQFPAGRVSDAGALISPETYGQILIELYDRWTADVPDFAITPLDQMFLKVAGREGKRCPWTKDCGGRFIEIEPNGDLYNCGEMADLGDPTYRFGNIFEHSLNHASRAHQADQQEQAVRFLGHHDPRNMPASDKVSYPEQLAGTPAMRQMKRRSVELPMDCTTCRHFEECQGGCMRDAELYGRGLGGKFFYCQSWKAVFDHIKRSIVTGQADVLARSYGLDPEYLRARVRDMDKHPDAAGRYAT